MINLIDAFKKILGSQTKIVKKLNSLDENKVNQSDIDDLLNSFNSSFLLKNETAKTAEKLKNERKIELTGAIVGSSYFDGSKNITIETSLNNITINASQIEGLVINWNSIHDRPDMNLYVLKDDFNILSNNCWLKTEKIGYNNLSGTPIIPLSTSQLINDTNFLTSFEEKDPIFVAHSGEFLPIGGIARSASKLSYERNIKLAGAVRGSCNFDGSKDIIIDTELSGITLDAKDITGLDLNISTNWADILGKPDLTEYLLKSEYNTEKLYTIALKSELTWNKISGRPTDLGNFNNSLSGYVAKGNGKTINWNQVDGRPTKVSDLTNDANYVAKGNGKTINWNQVDGRPTDLGNFNNSLSGYVAKGNRKTINWDQVDGRPTSFFSGNYGDLSGKPTDLGDFNNNKKGYVAKGNGYTINWNQVDGRPTDLGDFNNNKKGYVAKGNGKTINWNQIDDPPTYPKIDILETNYSVNTGETTITTDQDGNNYEILRNTSFRI